MLTDQVLTLSPQGKRGAGIILCDLAIVTQMFGVDQLTMTAEPEVLIVDTGYLVLLNNSGTEQIRITLQDWGCILSVGTEHVHGVALTTDGVRLVHLLTEGVGQRVGVDTLEPFKFTRHGADMYR